MADDNIAHVQAHAYRERLEALRLEGGVEALEPH